MKDNAHNYVWIVSKHIEFYLVLSRFYSSMYKNWSAIFKNSQLFFQIYSGFSGSLCESMSNFDGLFLLEFLSNLLRNLVTMILRY